MGPKMSVGTPPKGDAPTERATATAGEGSATRRRILQIALTLMVQRGVDGTSMPNLDAPPGRGPQRGVAVPLLPEQTGPAGVGADRAGVPPDQAGAPRPREPEPRRRAP